MGPSWILPVGVQQIPNPHLFDPEGTVCFADTLIHQIRPQGNSSLAVLLGML